jgi:two-component system, OmpR family, sensor histidine kinase ChvG
MAQAIDSQVDSEPGGQLRWPWQSSLTRRILAVNILAVGLLAGSLFYLDGFRQRLIDERMAKSASETALVAAALARVPVPLRAQLIGDLGAQGDTRIRLFNLQGQPLVDSWQLTGPRFSLQNPKENSFQRNLAREIDEAVDLLVIADVPPTFNKFGGVTNRFDQVDLRLAPDRTHILSTQVKVSGAEPAILLTDNNARDIRRIVRAERARLSQIILAAILFSVLLSLFLGRTIVQPLQQLAQAAMRVRMGRERDVIVPRLPNRVDEIGTLARAVSDMSQALQQRIDETEAFAADVAHELKNPLASLNSAVETLRTVTKPELRKQLQDIISDDVRRLDRLISDISELSRIDARLARVKLEKIDIGDLITGLLDLRKTRNNTSNVSIAYAKPAAHSTAVIGEPSQLGRVIDNLLDNAISFSPAGGVVRVAATRDGDNVLIMVDDDGPGIPEAAHEAIFERFHSDRPQDEAFGQHSGLGLAICRTIINGHGGLIKVAPRAAGLRGARLIVRLPALR